MVHMEVFFVRNNFSANDDKSDLCRKIKKSMFINNELGILVDQKGEMQHWDCASANIVCTGKKYLFIDRWFQMMKAIAISDVLIVSTYKEASDKIVIGVVKKGEISIVHPEYDCVKIVKFDRIKEFSNKEHPIFNSLIPQQATISRIVKMRDFVMYFSQEKILPLEIKYLSASGLEVICAEWLRSSLSRKFQMKFQFLKVGGNLADVDIYGLSIDDQEIIAQVTLSNSESLIQQKINKIKHYNKPIQIMFCDGVEEFRESCHIISIHRVFNDLKLNHYEKLIEKLIQG